MESQIIPKNQAEEEDEPLDPEYVFRHSDDPSLFLNRMLNNVVDWKKDLRMNAFSAYFKFKLRGNDY